MSKKIFFYAFSENCDIMGHGCRMPAPRGPEKGPRCGFGANQFLGIGFSQQNAVGRCRQKAWHIVPNAALHDDSQQPTAFQIVTALDLPAANSPPRRTGRSLSASTGSGKRFCPGLSPSSNAKLTQPLTRTVFCFPDADASG